MSFSASKITEDLLKDPEFNDLFEELRKTEYATGVHEIVHYAGTLLPLVISNDLKDEFISRIVESMVRKNYIAINSEEEVAKVVKHFIFSITIMCYVWNAIFNGKIKCFGEVPKFNAKNVHCNSYSSFKFSQEDIMSWGFGYTGKVQVDLYLKAANTPNPSTDEDWSSLILRFFASDFSTLESHYLDYLDIAIWSITAQDEIRATFSVQNFTIAKLERLLEDAAALKKKP